MRKLAAIAITVAALAGENYGAAVWGYQGAPERFGTEVWHDAPLDRNGCHPDGQGGYHCH
jgi:hypothetical protein